MSAGPGHAKQARTAGQQGEATPVRRKVAIITGAATGVGAAVARMLAGKGYDVLVNYSRSADAAEGVVAECRTLGADAFAAQGDVARDADCQALAQQAMARWGRIDALVCSAGATRFIPMGDLAAVTTADFERAYAVNSIGPFQMARAVQPHMQNGVQGGGAIVNVSSVAGLSGSGSSFPYVMSKAALNILTVALARNLAPAIRVNAVLPGLVEGRWMREGLGDDAAYERVKGQFAATAALGKVSKPEQIASAVCWLLEEDSVVTGQLIPVDAGFMLGKPPAAAGR
ncbi:MAG: Acetoacetyl-CoA reductase [Rhodoferax sp.]|nr:Acetoacetyl-CoA reductase [Rhodoferax sp.]